MKVDLGALRRAVEAKIESIDRKRVRLQEQLGHINAVEQLVLEFRAEAGSASKTSPKQDDVSNITDHPHRWFQQV